MKRTLEMVALVGILAALAAGTAYAQQPPPPPGIPGIGAAPPAAAPQQPGRPGMARPGGMAAGMGMAGAMQAPAAIAVADGFVFVVFGGTLFQFTVDGLQEVAQTQLTPPRRAAGREITPEMAENLRQRVRQQRGDGQPPAPRPAP